MVRVSVGIEPEQVAPFERVQAGAEGRVEIPADLRVEGHLVRVRVRVRVTVRFRARGFRVWP